MVQPEPVTVVAIHVAPASRLPTKAVEEVVAEAGRGLVGDRYHGTRHRHVSMQSLTDLAAASADLGLAIGAGATRRNVTVSHGPVPTAPGIRLWIGPVGLEVVRLAAPCSLLDGWIGRGARSAMHARGGTICRILEGGTISLGDELRIEA
jgi:MOSC domain-containing protein YiiM